jgi:hypothetical protein
VVRSGDAVDGRWGDACAVSADTFAATVERLDEGGQQLGRELLAGVLDREHHAVGRTRSALVPAGSWRGMSRRVRVILSDEFPVAVVRRAAPNASKSYISKKLAELRDQGVIQPEGTGKSVRWRPLRPSGSPQRPSPIGRRAFG